MDLLPALYQQFDPGKPLDASDPRYVDWQVDLDTDDLKNLVISNILNSHADGGSVTLVTGLRGTGKTSELRRVEGILAAGHRGQQAVVVYVSRPGGWSGHGPGAVMLKVAEAVATHPTLKPLLGGMSFSELATKVGKRLKLKLGVNVPFLGELSAAWDGQSAQRTDIELALRDNQSDFLHEINRGLRSALSALRASNVNRIVVIVDELDKLVDPNEIKAMFVGGQQWMKGMACDVVLTVPWEFHHSADGSRLNVDHGYGEVLELGVLPVDHRDGTPNDAARAELRKMVERRVAAARAIAPEGDLPPVFDRLPELIELSGGQLRVLFELIRKAINRADRADAADRAIESSMNELATGVTAAQRELLAVVHTEQDAKPEHPEWQSLLRNGRILLYVDGGRWYDVHPLLQRWLQQRASQGMS
jgi:hypothetical protein